MKNSFLFIFFCFLFLILVNLFYFAPNTTASPIINGIPDEHHLFKFHVSIQRKRKVGNEYEHVCGGSIISERYILTAAHCFITKLNDVIEEIFYPLGTTKIIAGTNHRNGPGIERDVVKAFIPLEYNVDSNYRPSSLLVEADLAVAELNADLGIQQHPEWLFTMPLEALDPHSNAGVNDRAIFCGFGPDKLVQNSDGQFYPVESGSTISRYMDVKILGRAECTRFDTAICTISTEKTEFRTSCYGDSGAGLVYNNRIVGVLSAGPRLCNSFEPIVFTRLYDYMRFIEEAQNPRGDHRIMMVLDENLKSPLKVNRNPKHPPSSHYDGSSFSSAQDKKKSPQAKNDHSGPGKYHEDLAHH